jgi:hypothetical protein
MAPEVFTAPGTARDGVHLSDRRLSDLGRLLVYVAAFSGIVVIASLGGRLVVAAGFLAVYAFLVFVSERALWARTPWPLPQPVIAISVFWIAMYGVFALPKFASPDKLHPVLVGHESYLYLALVAVMVGNAALLLGYLLLWPTPLDRSKLTPKPLKGRLSFLMIGAVWGMSLLARGYLVSTARFGYLADFSTGGSSLRQTFTYVYEFAWLAIAALVVETLTAEDETRRSKCMLFLATISLVELASVVVMGFKGYALHTFMPALFCLWGYLRSVPKKALVGAVVLLIAISPGNFKYREAVNTGTVSKGNFFDAAQAALVYTVEGLATDPWQAVVQTWENFTFEFADYLENTALILYKTPSLVPHRGADWYFTAIPRALFPRFIWQDKPVDDMAAYMTVVYREFSATTGSPPGFVGDLYMRAGWGAVVFGSLVGGFLLGLVMKIFANKPRKDLFIAGASVFAASFSNTHLDSLIVYLVHRSILYSAVAWLLFYSPKPRGTVEV